MDPGLLCPSVTLSPSHFTNTKVRIPTQSSTSKVYNFFKVPKLSLHHAVFPNKPLSLPVSFSLCFPAPRVSLWLVVPRRQGRGSVIFFGKWGIPVPFCTRSDLRLSRCPCTAFFSRIFFWGLFGQGLEKKKVNACIRFFFPTFSGSDVTMSTRRRSPPRFFPSPCDGGSF